MERAAVRQSSQTYMGMSLALILQEYIYKDSTFA
jgi:hypothetical protein